MNHIQIIGHLFGFVALILGFTAYQAKNQKQLLLWQMANSMAFVLHYLLIGAPSACALNTVTVVRNLAYYRSGRRGAVLPAYPVIFSLAMVVFGILTWEGGHSLLVIVANVVNCVCVALGNTQSIRKSILLTSTLVFIYDIFVLSVGGMIYELVAIASSAIGLCRYRKR